MFADRSTLRENERRRQNARRAGWEKSIVSWFDRFSRVKQRESGKLDSGDPASYKRFKNVPKSDTTHLLYRGETRSPEMIKQKKGFFPQPGKSNVSDSGGSTAMVCLTLSPDIAATYYAYVKQYYKSPTWGDNKPNGYVYACFLPTGRGIMNFKMAEAVGSKNVGSQEISALVIPWEHVAGWRQLPDPEQCKPVGKDYTLVDYLADFVPNEDFKGDMSVVAKEGLETFQEFIGFTNAVIHNSNRL